MRGLGVRRISLLVSVPHAIPRLSSPRVTGYPLSPLRRQPAFGGLSYFQNVLITNVFTGHSLPTAHAKG